MRFSKVVKVGDVLLGGGNKIAVQSMTNTRTADTDATIKQIRELEGAGCDIVRVAVLDLSDAAALKKIKDGIGLPAGCRHSFRFQTCRCRY